MGVATGGTGASADALPGLLAPRGTPGPEAETAKPGPVASLIGRYASNGPMPLSRQFELQARFSGGLQHLPTAGLALVRVERRSQGLVLEIERQADPARPT